MPPFTDFIKKTDNRMENYIHEIRITSNQKNSYRY